MDGSAVACLIILALAIVAIVAVLIGRANAQDDEKKRLQAAFDAYQSALARLKKDPTNADYKQHALQVGRAYADFSRRQQNQRGVTIFDEMALSNDISAATAGAGAVQVAPRESVESRLQQLEGLRTKGLISATEYDEKRKRLIAEM